MFVCSLSFSVIWCLLVVCLLGLVWAYLVVGLLVVIYGLFCGLLMRLGCLWWLYSCGLRVLCRGFAWVSACLVFCGLLDLCLRIGCASGRCVVCVVLVLFLFVNAVVWLC